MLCSVDLKCNSSKELLDDNKTDAFVVVHNGQLVYERYFNGYNESEPHGMASLAKVFTGAIIQSLAEENRIDLEKRLTHI